MKFLPLVLCALLVGVACSDTNIIVPTSPSTLPVTNPNPTPNVPVVQTHKIEYRVTGNATGALVRYSNSNDGIAQVTTVLPFVFNITTNQQSIFLSLSATPTGYGFSSSPFMAVQIFVNGVLFRETASADFFMQTLTVSGTWRQ